MTVSLPTWHKVSPWDSIHVGFFGCFRSLLSEVMALKMFYTVRSKDNEILDMSVNLSRQRKSNKKIRYRRQEVGVPRRVNTIVVADAYAQDSADAPILFDERGCSMQLIGIWWDFRPK